MKKYQKLIEYLKERKKDLLGIERDEGELTPEGRGMLTQILAIEQVSGIKL